MKKLLLLLTVLSSCVVFKPRPEPRYCVVVDEVIYKKNNTASIRRFRYPNHNIHRGDTVEITMKDAIGPRF